jgi:hypothetical protein
MEHSGLLHPEFGFLCPPPRLRRELRIAMTCLLLGGIAGALCILGVIALRVSDSASLGSAAASSAAASRDVELGAAPGADSSAPRPELAAHTAVPPASAEASAGTSAQTSAQAAAIASKPRVVRIPRIFDSPAIARLPLGRSEAPAAASQPVDNPPASPQAVNAVAGHDVPAAASEKSVPRSGPRERTASAPSPKKVQKTARNGSHRRNEPGNDDSWRDDRLYDWSARAAVVNDAGSAVGRAYAREGSSSIRGFWDWSR